MQEQITEQSRKKETSTIKREISFIQSNSSWIYFVLAIAISWGLVIAILGIDGIPGTTQEQEDKLNIIVFTLLTGPIFASLTMIGTIYGSAGYKDLFNRMSRWKVNYRWYLLAIFGAPLIGALTLLPLTPFSDEYLPAIYTTDDRISLIAMGLIIGLSAGLFEEIGWTGFAVPELRQKYSIVKTGLIVGFFWGVWHYITAFWGAGNETGSFVFYDKFLPMMIFYIVVLPAFRVSMVWLYDKTQSLLLIIMMHGSLTGSVIYILLSPDLMGNSLSLWYMVFAIPLWMLVWVISRFENKSTT